MNTIEPVELLEKQLKELKYDKQKAKLRNGLIWHESTFLKCDELIQKYEKSISIISGF